MTDHSNVSEVRLGALDKAVPTYQQTRPTEYHAIGSLTIAPGGAGANYACPGTGTKYDIKGLKLQISCAAVGNNMVGGDALTVYFYQLRDGTYYLLDTKAITTLATTAGSVTKVEVTCDYADTSELHGATHFAIAGNVAVAAGGATGSTVYVDYDLFADEDVTLEYSGTIGAVTVAAIGATTDTPLAGDVAEDATARTGVSLWKRMVNKLIELKGLLTTIDSDTSGIVTGIGAVTDAPVADNTTVEDATARSEISLLKRVANLLIALLKQAYISATNHLRVGEINPIDNRAVQVTAIASNVTVTQNTVTWWPGAVTAAAPTSCWDTFSLNAAGGKAKQVSFTGSMTTGAGVTGYFKVYATDDPNATVASKRWVQIAMYDMRAAVKAVVENVSCTNTTVAFVVNIDEFTPRYLVVSFSETANVGNVTAVYLDASFGW